MSIPERHVSTDSEAGDGYDSVANSAIPIKAVDAAVRESATNGTRHLIFVADRENMFYVNAVGKEIFEMCDGDTRVNNIVARLQSAYRVPADVDVNAIVRKYLRLLERTGAIQLKETES